MSRAGRWVLAFAVFACNDDTARTAGSGGGSSSTGPTSDAGTGASTSVGDAGTGTTGGTSSGGSTGMAGSDTAGGESTGGPNPQQFAPECGALCMHAVACALAAFDPCMEHCLDYFHEDRGDCLALGGAALTCLDALTCDELAVFFEFPSFTACSPESEVYEQTCWCQGQNLLSPDGTYCGATRDCPFAPHQAMGCWAGVCKCYVDGEESGQCPAGDACESFDAVDAKTLPCCGF